MRGDDLTTAGPKQSLDWYEAELSKVYEFSKGGRLGPGDTHCKDGTISNIGIRWCSSGLDYGAGPRHAEKLLQDMSLTGSNSNTTPGVKALNHKVLEDKDLPASEHTWFKGLAARANYLSADRPDCQIAAEEACRPMARPTLLAKDALKMLCKYLIGRQRLVSTFPYQSAGTSKVYSNTGCAGCPRTRKSTSGACLVMCRHVLKTWSSTQASVSLSSGNAELYGVVRAAGVGLGHHALLHDVGHP